MAMTAADYLDQMRQLLPPGPAWEGELGREVDEVLVGLAPELERIDRRGNDLISEMNPATIRELLPDWERVMGLPDPCLGADQSFEDRRAAVFQRLTAVGSQRLDYFVQLAVSMGYPHAEGFEYRAPRMGRSRFGSAHFGTWAQQFFWGIRLGGRLEGGRRYCVSVWGERFGANPAAGVECVIRRWAPSHLVVRFDYE